MAHLNEAVSYEEQVFRDDENSSIANLEHPESFEIISISGIDEQTAMLIGVAKIEASVSFSILGLICIYTTQHTFFLSGVLVQTITMSMPKQ